MDPGPGPCPFWSGLWPVTRLDSLAHHGPLWEVRAGPNGPQTQRKTEASHFFFFFHVYFLLFFIFFVKCPGSSITYKHDLYRGVDGKAGRGGVTGDAPLLAAPLGLGPFGHFGGTGTPQHLPEVVWPPLPLVLRIL